MHIRQHLSLYFFNEIQDWRVNDHNQSLYYLNSYSSQFFSKSADYLLKDSYRWFGHYIYLANNLVQIQKQNIFPSTISKIKSFVFAFLFFPMGIFIKSLYTMYNFSYVYQRNQYILEQIHSNETKEKQTVICSQKQFKEVHPQTQSLLCSIPQELFFNILLFTQNKEICFLSQTCKQNYANIVDFVDVSYQFDSNYAPALVKALDKKFSQISFSFVMPKLLIRALKIMESYEKFFRAEPVDPYALQRRLSENYQQMSVFDNFMQIDKQTMIKFRTTEGYAIQFQIRDCILKQTQTLIFTKDELIVGHWKLSNNLLAFLKKIYSSDTTRCVEYLKRLFDQKPCGNFPDPAEEPAQNNDSSSGLLEEGSVVCEDRYTPVIQLCQYSSAQAETAS